MNSNLNQTEVPIEEIDFKTCLDVFGTLRRWKKEFEQKQIHGKEGKENETKVHNPKSSLEC